MNAEKRRRIVELKAEGLTHVVIAERLGVHINTVSKYDADSLTHAPRRARSGELCSVDGCGRRVDAARLCSTHRRRRRLKLDLTAPIRRHAREVSISDLLEAAFDAYDEDDEAEYERKRRRFSALVRRWASCP